MKTYYQSILTEGVMLLDLVLISFVVPASINWGEPMALSKPYVAQAVIDSARIIGLPSSKAAKTYAKKIQTPDPIFKQFTYTPEPVSERRLFFKNYFQQSI